eukprot:scaffold5751_cov112-Isochrysis_galbana.AAC.5
MPNWIVRMALMITESSLKDVRMRVRGRSSRASEPYWGAGAAQQAARMARPYKEHTLCWCGWAGDTVAPKDVLEKCLSFQMWNI